LLLVTAYGIAAALGTLQDITHGCRVPFRWARWPRALRFGRAYPKRAPPAPLPAAISCSCAPLLLWVVAALAMIVYAMALPNRYDIACGAFAFTLIVTLAASGLHSVPLLAARGWETFLGGALGLAAAMFICPLRASPGTGG
jgi:hypothetical protein